MRGGINVPIRSSEHAANVALTHCGPPFLSHFQPTFSHPFLHTAPKDGRPMFRYVYSTAYKTNQMLFEQAQASHDPNAIAALLQHAPYHVDSLLAMHDLYRHMGENAYAEV